MNAINQIKMIIYLFFF